MLVEVKKMIGYTFQPITTCITCDQITSTCENTTENPTVSVLIKVVNCYPKLTSYYMYMLAGGEKLVMPQVKRCSSWSSCGYGTFGAVFR